MLCKISNTKLGSVEIQKETLGATGGPFTFGLTGQSNLPGFSTTQAGVFQSAGTFANLAAGSYTPSETADSSWSKGTFACTDKSGGASVAIPIQLVAGQNVLCKISNTKLGSVEIQKQTVGAVGGPFTFGLTGQSNLPGFSTTQAGVFQSAGTFANLAAGSYTPSETADSSWSKGTFACTDKSGGASVAIPIQLVAGQNVLCKISNTKLGLVEIQKQTVGAVGGPFTFGLTGQSNLPGFSTTQAGVFQSAGTFANLAAGSYTPSETADSSWSKGTFACTDKSGGASVAIPIQLVAGQNVLCKISNTKLGSVEIQKQTVGAVGGPFTFGLTGQSNLPGFSTTQAGCSSRRGRSPTWRRVRIRRRRPLIRRGRRGRLPAPTRVVGLRLRFRSSWLRVRTCCEISNTKLGSVEIQKQTVGAVGGPFTFGLTGQSNLPGFSTTQAGVFQSAGTFANLAAGSYTPSETADSSWSKGTFACTDKSGGASVAIPIQLVAGQNVLCKISNTKLGSVEIQKQTVGAVGGPFTFGLTGQSNLPGFSTTPGWGVPVGGDVRQLGGGFVYAVGDR